MKYLIPFSYIFITFCLFLQFQKTYTFNLLFFYNTALLVKQVPQICSKTKVNRKKHKVT